MNNQENSVVLTMMESDPEICLAAVRQDGWALRYVIDQTHEICLAAVRQNKDASQYVRDLTMLTNN